MDYYTGEVKEISRTAYSTGLRSKVNCYGANDVTEGVAIMHKEKVDVSITGNSTNPTRFQHPVAGTYKKECIEQGKKYFLPCSIHSFLYVPATGCWKRVGFVELPVIDTSTFSLCMIATPSVTSLAP